MHRKLHINANAYIYINECLLKLQLSSFYFIPLPGSRNRAARQRALQINYRPCRLISHLKREKKNFFSFSLCDKHSYFCTSSSKKYCTEVNDYSFSRQ